MCIIIIINSVIKGPFIMVILFKLINLKKGLFLISSTPWIIILNIKFSSSWVNFAYDCWRWTFKKQKKLDYPLSQRIWRNRKLLFTLNYFYMYYFDFHWKKEEILPQFQKTLHRWTTNLLLRYCHFNRKLQDLNSQVLDSWTSY